MDYLPFPYNSAPGGHSTAKSTMCTATDLGLHPQPGVTLPEPAHCPVNGFGGSWYYEPFGYVPVYNRGAPGVNDTVTWAAIDEWATSAVANIWVTYGTCLGLCLATLAYIIALTPNKKRGMPFHTSLLLALLFEIARLLFDVSRSSNIGLSPYSAYLSLTNDTAASSASVEFRALEIAASVCAVLAFIFTVICFYVQASGLLTGLHLQRRTAYFCLIGYLVGASVVALCLRIALTVIRGLLETGTNQNVSLDLFSNIQEATAIAYAISIGSWCSISLASVLCLMFTRSKLIVSNRPYDTALTILSLAFMESFVVPIVFVVLQAFPQFPVPELVVIPSVLVLLPMGSLFMTVHTAEVRNLVDRGDDAPANAPHDPLPELESRPIVNSQSATVFSQEPHISSEGKNRAYSSGSYPLTTLDTPARKALAANLVDRELRAIDNMDGEDVEPVFGSTETDTVLQARAKKVRKALEARSVTPVSSKAEVV